MKDSKITEQFQFTIEAALKPLLAMIVFLIALLVRYSI